MTEKSFDANYKGLASEYSEYSEYEEGEEEMEEIQNSDGRHSLKKTKDD